MREYKTSILIGIIYISAFIFIHFVRTITVITALFLVLHFTFNGVLVLLGKRAEKLHRRFVETHLATVLALSLYGVSTGIYFATLKNFI
ncbi:hypothetical protein [Clostridium thermarum]|uniref:hypothetical protein n=1 Tax=Clostridium thermarum TaxID=1716543 RepID=UPI00112301AA|nr:hypothetical protein [Clostridium thermarum]